MIIMGIGRQHCLSWAVSESSINSGIIDCLHKYIHTRVYSSCCQFFHVTGGAREAAPREAVDGSRILIEGSLAEFELMIYINEDHRPYSSFECSISHTCQAIHRLCYTLLSGSARVVLGNVSQHEYCRSFFPSGYVNLCSIFVFSSFPSYHQRYHFRCASLLCRTESCRRGPLAISIFLSVSSPVDEVYIISFET